MKAITIKKQNKSNHKHTTKTQDLREKSQVGEKPFAVEKAPLILEEYKSFLLISHKP